MNISASKLLIDSVLVSFFFLICMGLGYAVLNRFDPLSLTALEDLKAYGNIVENGISSWEESAPGIRHRVLVPFISHIIYVITPPIGSWNMVNFSALIVNSLFTSFSALTILKMSYKITNKQLISIIACFIFLLNFNIVNLYLAGSIDAAFGFFLLLLLYCMQFEKWKLIPILAIFGCLTKEVFLPVGSSFILGWLIYEYYEDNKIKKNHLGIFILFMFVGTSTLMLMSSYVTQTIFLPWEHLSSRTKWVYMELNFFSFVAEFIRFVFITGWLLILALFSVKIIPIKIIFSTLVASIVIIFLGWWLNVGGADYARFIFSTAAFIISLCSGITLTKIFEQSIRNK